MRRLIPAATLLALLSVVLFASAQQGAAKPPIGTPKGFFGVAPQTMLTPEDVRYMKAGGIGSIRWPMIWAAIQPHPRKVYDWGSFDPIVEMAARAGLEVLPSIGSPPSWVTGKETTMPVDTRQQRQAWKEFLAAAVARYGPGGEFWRENQTGGIGPAPDYKPDPPLRPVPIRAWQIWNESNFFYFSFPVSPVRYAKLVKVSSAAIKAVQPSAKVVLSGLFGEPTAKGKKGMPAAKFLDRLYAVPGLKNRFDGISLHPYAVDAETLEELVEEFHSVAVKHRDVPGLYITEMGWGSQNNFEEVAFEQGVRGQVRQLRASYRYLLGNRGRLNLKQVYWFSWKDTQGLCNFCDSVGLFREGAGFHPKPSWRAFVALSGGRARP